MRANLVEDEFEAIVSFGHANMIRRKVGEICLELMEDEEAFQTRGDKEWVLMTLAEVYQGQGREKDEKRLGPKIEAAASEFGRDAYETQRVKLADLMARFEGRPGPRLLRSGTAPEAAAPAEGEEAQTVTTVYRPTISGGERGPITIDADLVRDKPVRSIEVNCKIEYE